MHHLLLLIPLLCIGSIGISAEGGAHKALNATTCTLCGKPIDKALAPVVLTYKNADDKEMKARIAVCSDECKTKADRSRHPEQLVEAAKADKKVERKKKPE